MASNKPAPEATYNPFGPYGSPAEPGLGYGDQPLGEWNPTEESIAPVRGRHRVAKQRGGGMARSGAVLGVGVIAAVGAGGMATAKDKPRVPISMPDLSTVADSLPDAKSLPGIGDLISDGSDTDVSAAELATAAAPLTQAGLTDAEADKGADAGEALRARILQQADQQQAAADQASLDASSRSAAEQAAGQASKTKSDAEAKAKAEKAEAKRKAEAAAEKKAEAERRAQLAKSFVLPVASYTLTSSFGQAGDLWSANHTGQDFAAPTGTPAKALHSGTIKSAGWAGSYGYRIVLQLDDGTELWYCHLSSMVKTSGQVNTGDVIARVGATGNVTGPHLHLEVRPGGSPIDPMGWLRERGLQP
ncbi:M23 family metallopeptidase [Streptomyces sp. H27-D2]|uniref:M23 family metallopeptidase n=1 Tax=Streptomyces sp. H27-D2 TaxID=3046304 RepID=UPI002DBE3BBC|nr:M23 family metallopeptidase [Streptomyces sp. H27-D2]MEC4018134.1 M23 family metallopeptidase [Streptomyces sp. H27-D2]